MDLIKDIREILDQFLDLVFPPRCIICREFIEERPTIPNYGAISFCPTCLSDFQEIPPSRCLVCSRPFDSTLEDIHTCGTCLTNPPRFKRLAVPYLYEGSLMAAIHQFKYGGKSYTAGTLARLLLPSAAQLAREIGNPLVMPVPLHPRRLRERGFNQSLLLARPVAKRLSLRLDYLSLRRTKYTLPQIGLKKDKRRKNVRRAFEVHHRNVIKGEKVLLVDDVATTGNTLNECARVLLGAGCKEVYALVLARTAGH
ncbi:MAG: ComF family protein [Deltaproteobacteria bacterium]|nr:ComF family protein [Deltaproteobacteria bacterium]